MSTSPPLAPPQSQAASAPASPSVTATATTTVADQVEALRKIEQRVLAGGAPKYHEKNAAEGKLFCRERLRRLFDEGSDFVEDGLLANDQAEPSCPPTA